MELLFKIQLGYIAILFVLNMNVFSLGQEIEAHGSPAMQTINLLLHKRSRTNYNANEHESESRNYEECSVQKPSPSQNTIIKSSASIDNGAKYLSARNGTSSFECFNLCCKDSACDTSIYEDKGNHRCYLFHCNGLCKFKEHADYVVWALDRQARTPPPKKEEEELARLHSKPGSNADDGGDPHGGRDRDDHDANNGDEDEHRPRSNSNSEEDADSSRRSDESDRSKAGPATYGRKPNPTYVAPHTAGLSGFCDSDVSCEDPNAGCFDRACQCKKGFYNKNGLCREVCAQSDFECLTLGTSGRGPECIPKTKLCDSYMQCADGSDEYNCRSQDEQSGITKNKGTYPPGLKASTHVEVKPDVHKTKSTSSSDVKDADIKPSPATIPKGNDKASTLSHESTKNKTKQNSDVGGPTSGSKTILITTKKPSSLIKSNSNSKVFVTHEKVIIASSTSEAEGPIIALSLGLAFTLILIGLLACRLRNMKHRLRKGRPLNSNEADYLINGMYL